jgi:hypothetical protein
MAITMTPIPTRPITTILTITTLPKPKPPAETFFAS